MEARDIYITEHDLTRLKQLLQVGIGSAERDRELLDSLRSELDRAHIVEPATVPHDVVTMHSRVRLKDLETNEEMLYTLVFPAEADLEQGKISILAPMGTAMLGYGVGDEVQWRVPGGNRKFRIEEVLYQPEAAGHYNL
jgi:regulator of nucleoside diphosphate kinase